MRPRAQGQAGFTLVEVVVAASLLAVAALGLSAAIVISLRAAAVEREKTVALAAAEARMDQLLALLSRGDAAVDVGAPVPFAVEGLTAVAPSTQAGVATVSSWVDELVYVDVTVRWRGSLGEDQVQLATLARR